MIIDAVEQICYIRLRHSPINSIGQEAGMSRKRMSLAGLAGIVAGALIVIGATLGELVSEYFWFLLAPAMLLIVFALVGFQSRQREQAGRLGKAGYVMGVIGFAVLGVLFLVLGSLESIFGVDLEASEGLGVTVTEIVIIAAFFSLILGTLLYGIATLRANVFPRIAAVLLLASLPVALVIDIATGAFTDEALTPWGVYIGFPLFGLGVAWLGYALWMETRAPVAVAREEPGPEEAEAPAPGGD
jgi:hypothetical protein